jgi:mannosyltransferase OCH1-like enzyme
VVIPPIIHRIWLDEPMPGAFREFGERWQRLHPTWAVQDWTSSAVLASDLSRLDMIHAARSLFPKDWRRFQADVLRLSLLARYGGLYVDTDVEPFRNIQPLLDGHACVVGRSVNADAMGYHAITNSVMAAAPGHAWIQALVDGLPEALARFGNESLARAIGPWHLDRTYSAGTWPTVLVLDHREMFEGGWLRHWWNNARRHRGAGIG